MICFQGSNSFLYCFTGIEYFCLSVVSYQFNPARLKVEYLVNKNVYGFLKTLDYEYFWYKLG